MESVAIKHMLFSLVEWLSAAGHMLLWLLYLQCWHSMGLQFKFWTMASNALPPCPQSVTMSPMYCSACGLVLKAWMAILNNWYSIHRCMDFFSPTQPGHPP